MNFPSPRVPTLLAHSALIASTVVAVLTDSFAPQAAAVAAVTALCLWLLRPDRSPTDAFMAVTAAAVTVAAVIPLDPYSLRTTDLLALAATAAFTASVGTAFLGFAVTRRVTPWLAALGALTAPTVITGIANDLNSTTAMVAAAVAATAAGFAAPRPHDRFGVPRLALPAVAMTTVGLVGLALDTRLDLFEILGATTIGAPLIASTLVAAGISHRHVAIPTGLVDVSQPCSLHDARAVAAGIFDQFHNGTLTFPQTRAALAGIIGIDDRDRRWVLDPDTGRWRQVDSTNQVQVTAPRWKSVAAGALVVMFSAVYFAGGTDLTTFARTPPPPPAVPSQEAVEVINAADNAGPYSGSITIRRGDQVISFDHKVFGLGSDVWFQWNGDRSNAVPIYDPEFLEGAGPPQIRVSPWGTWVSGGPFTRQGWAPVDVAPAGDFPLDGIAWWRDLITSGPQVVGMGSKFDMVGRDRVAGVDAWRVDLGTIDMHAVAESNEFPPATRSLARSLWRSYPDTEWQGFLWMSSPEAGVPIRVALKAGNATITWDFEPPGDYPALPEPGSILPQRTIPSLLGG